MSSRISCATRNKTHGKSANISKTTGIPDFSGIEISNSANTRLLPSIQGGEKEDWSPDALGFSVEKSDSHREKRENVNEHGRLGLPDVS